MPILSWECGENMVRSLYLQVRHLLRQVRFLRSGLYLYLSFRALLTNNPQRVWRYAENQFRACVDPWDFANASEQLRYSDALELLNSVSPGQPFQRVLEVGCAEGAFTERLAPYCESLLAVDFSPTALERARKRCHANEVVQFAEWDLRSGPLPRKFDLVVAMSVLEMLVRPRALREARKTLVDTLDDGGYLLVTSTRSNAVIEEAWWSQYFILGKCINGFLARHPVLRTVEVRTGSFYEVTLFQKCAEVAQADRN